MLWSSKKVRQAKAKTMLVKEQSSIARGSEFRMKLMKTMKSIRDGPAQEEKDIYFCKEKWWWDVQSIDVLQSSSMYRFLLAPKASLENI